MLTTCAPCTAKQCTLIRIYSMILKITWVMIIMQLSKLKVVITAINKYGYYSYFGDENCKLSTLDDWIDRAPNVQ